jgi:hypothetical protein
MWLNQRVLSLFLSEPMGTWSARAIYAKLNYVGVGVWHDLLTGAEPVNLSWITISAH